jgi:hypothetical protein
MNEQMNEQSHPWREDLGAYLVGALDTDEAARMRRHLEECAECRAEYAELAPVVDLLAKVPAEALAPETTPSAPPDPEGWERLRARAGLAGPAAPASASAHTPSRPPRPNPGTGPGAAAGGRDGAGRADRPANRGPRRIRRPLRPTAAAAVSGALVAAAAFGLYAGLNHDDGGGDGQTTTTAGETISAVNHANGVSGTVKYSPADWGSSVSITLKGVKPGDDCVLYAMDSAGDKAVASTWWAPPVPGQSATIPGAVAMQAWDIKTFQVTTTVGEVLLTIPAS